jgi:hypothetical protein
MKVVVPRGGKLGHSIASQTSDLGSIRIARSGILRFISLNKQRDKEVKELEYEIDKIEKVFRDDTRSESKTNGISEGLNLWVLASVSSSTIVPVLRIANILIFVKI